MTFDKRSTSQRISDMVTWFCGSWTFIFGFACFTALWLWYNHSPKTFDPYPFILLNLVFTVVELFQGPLIMMSENRQKEIEHEYVLEMNAKLDKIWERLNDL